MSPAGSAAPDGARRPAPDRRSAAAAGGARAPEVALYAAIALALALFALFRAGGPYGYALHNDSYQYLSVADHLARDGSAATSIVHFDTERAHGRVPAPVTTFPPGYPAVISLLSFTGLAPEWLGVLVSLAGTAGVVLLLRRAGRILGFAPLGERLAMFLWAVSAHAAFFGFSVLTESLFTATSTAAIVLLLPDEQRTGRAPRTVLAAVLIGLAWWIRYAGLFFVIAFNLYALARSVRDSRRWVWALGVVSCDAIVAVGLARNVLIAGTWRGGNTRTVAHSLWSTALDFTIGHASLVLGWGSASTRASFLIPALLAVVGGLATAVVWARALPSARAPTALRRSAHLMVTWIAVYEAAMFYAGATTDISVGARMFFPLLPLVLLLLGAAATAAQGPPGAGAPGVPARVLLTVFLVGYAGVNVDGILHPRRLSPHIAVARALAAPMADGRTLASWIEADVSPDAVLFAQDGQATGYVLKRPTVSLVSKHYSDVSWEDDETSRAMLRFGAEYLLVYRGSGDGDAPAPPDAVMSESRLLLRLAADRPPSWLELAASNPRALVYRLRR